jgi:antitoxin component YwqK of YwqJK toxin-antitoxin module
MDKYFTNAGLLQNTLLPYFCVEEPLIFLNKFFFNEKYNTHLQPHGIFDTYYKDTKTIQEKYNYKNGKLNSIFESWYPDRQLWEKCNYFYDKKNGLYERWFLNGKLWEQGYYKNGVLDGSYKIWHNNDRLCVRKNYKNGKLSGLYELWNQNGQSLDIKNYKYGVESNIFHLLIFAFMICIIIGVLAVGNYAYLKYF